MYQGKLKVFTSCANLKHEAQNYVWKKDKSGITKDDPVDKENHLMDAMRYMVMALPYDIRECASVGANDATKETILDRLRLNDDAVEYDDSGVYGLGNFEL